MVNRLIQLLGAGLSQSPVTVISDYLTRKTKNGDEFAGLGSFLENRDIKRAEAFVRQRLFEETDCVFTNLAGAALELDKGDTRGAFKHLKKVCRKSPANTVAQYTLGYCYERMGLPGEALTCYEDANKFEPYWQLPLKRTAAIYFKQAQLENCLEQYRKLGTINPGDITTRLVTGYLYLAAGSFRKAKHKFEDAIIAGPQQQVQSNTPEDKLAEQGQFQQALEHINRQFVETPSQPELLYKRARIYTNLEQFDEAIQDYQSALQICPDYIEAAIQLAGIYSHSNRFIEAARLYYKALNTNSRYIELYIALSSANLQLDGKKNACETLSLAGSLIPNNRILTKSALENHFLAGAVLNKTQQQIEEDRKQLFSAMRNEFLREAKSSASDPFTAYLSFLLNEPDSTGAADTDNTFYRSVKRSGFAPAGDIVAAGLCENKSYSAAFRLLPSGKLPSGSSLDKYYRTAVLYSNPRVYTAARERLKSRLGSAVPPKSVDTYLTLAIFNLGMLSLDSVLFRTVDSVLEKTGRTIHSK